MTEFFQKNQIWYIFRQKISNLADFMIKIKHFGRFLGDIIFNLINIQFCRLLATKYSIWQVLSNKVFIWQINRNTIFSLTDFWQQNIQFGKF